MEVYIVTDTAIGQAIKVFNHYLYASEYLDQKMDKGAPDGRYRIDGPLEVIKEVSNYRLGDKNDCRN